jgi:hypothetical protein
MDAKDLTDLPKKEEEVNALSDNKVDVEIEPDVKSNKINIQLCSCSILFNCFTLTKPNEKN